MKTQTAESRPARISTFPRHAPGAGFFRRLQLRILGRRRRILVNPRYQIRAALMGVTGMGFLVALTVFLLSGVEDRRTRGVLETVPSLRPALDAAHRTEILLVVAGGILFMAGVFLAGIVESRRTAGPILNLRRRLDELRSGRLRARVLLRRHDNFPELAGAFNDMAGALRARVEGEVATLGRLAAQASDLIREESRGNHEGARRLAETLRQALEDARRRKLDLLEP